MNKTSLKRKVFNLIPRFVTNIIFKNKINSNVAVSYNNAFLKNCKIRCNGENNKIILSSGASVAGCSFHFLGDNNTVYIGENAQLNKVEFWIEDSSNRINVGDGTTTSGQCQFAAIEGTVIDIGKDCMFSSQINLRTGDSHSIIQNGKRINESRDIKIGNHVWIGTQVNILKGTKICDNSIVGACSLVSAEFEEDGIIIAGVPAKKIKENIDWDRKRI